MCSIFPLAPPVSRSTSSASWLTEYSVPEPTFSVSPGDAGGDRGAGDRGRRVVDVGEVARLGPVAEHHEALPRQRAHDEAGDDLARVALVVGARPVRVEGPQDHRGEAVAAVEGPGVALAGQLARAVHRVRIGRVILRHRRRARRAVDLGGGDVHEALDAGLPCLREEHERAGGVHLVVLAGRVDRVPHAEAGEVEHEARARQGARELLRVAHVPVEEARHSPGVRRAALEVRRAPRREVVVHEDLGAGQEQDAGEGRADEAGPPTRTQRAPSRAATVGSRISASTLTPRCSDRRPARPGPPAPLRRP